MPGADRALPVGELLARQAAAPHRLDPALLERLFHSGRYLLFSASGVLPPRLTGLWLGSWDAAWAGDFTTDANLNLQLAGANVGALPEVTAAHARLVAAQVDRLARQRPGRVRGARAARAQPHRRRARAPVPRPPGLAVHRVAGRGGLAAAPAARASSGHR